MNADIIRGAVVAAMQDLAPTVAATMGRAAYVCPSIMEAVTVFESGVVRVTGYHSSCQLSEDWEQIPVEEIQHFDPEIKQIASCLLFGIVGLELHNAMHRHGITPAEAGDMLADSRS